MQEAKAEIRKKMRAHVSTLKEDYIRESNEKIFKALVSRKEYQDAEKIFIYYSTGREVDTVRVLRHALESGKTVALPKIIGNGIMVPVLLRSEQELTAGRFGIPAPAGDEVLSSEDTDLIIIPGVAFTKDGQRLGRGGGYYDRFLSSCSAFKIGLARKHAILPTLPADQLDMKVDLVITD